jgi:hypothetical protein
MAKKTHTKHHSKPISTQNKAILGIIAAIIVILAGVIGITVFMDSDEFDMCDFNNDGIVNDREKQHCQEQIGDDDNGTVDNIEITDPVYSEGNTIVDFRLPSDSTGTGTLAVRLQMPEPGNERYSEGAPIIIWNGGGYEVKGINHELAPEMDDTIIITYIFQGGSDDWSGLSSDGVYDYRGEDSIKVLRDVILFAAGQLTDATGKTIHEISTAKVADNIGMIGISNGGNIEVAVGALFGDEIKDYLDYIIQWETPVSSQIATRDFGRMLMQPLEKGVSQQGDYFNLRYQGFGLKILDADYSDLTYNPDSIYPVFHDGNGDGIFTVKAGSYYRYDTPDLDDNNVLELDEDFGLDTYPYETYDVDGKQVYSRPVMHALENVITDWPDYLATVEQSDDYWDIREAVWMYDEVIAKIPNIEAMILAGEEDHVQSCPDKFNIRQAYEGWKVNGVSWVQINPSPEYILELKPDYTKINLPDNQPNTAPNDWADVLDYTFPMTVYKSIYQTASVWQMADRVSEN